MKEMRYSIKKSKLHTLINAQKALDLIQHKY